MIDDASCSLRRATAADRPAIAGMAREVVEAGEMFVFERVGDVLDYWESPGATTYVAELEGRVAGTYVVKPNQKGRGAHVANAGYMVAAEFRRRGLGRRLGEHSLGVARALGFHAMQFNMVVATNASAVRLWEELGFRIVGTVPRVFLRPCGEYADAHVMYREL